MEKRKKEKILAKLRERVTQLVPRDYLYASDLGQCRRRVAAATSGRMETISPQVRVFRAAGRALQDEFRKELEGAFGKRRVEQEIESKAKVNEQEISGRADFVVEVDGEPVCVEFKTTGAQRFAHLLSRRLPPTFAYQAGFYQQELKMPTLLVVENFSTGERHEFPVTMPEHTLKQEVSFLKPVVQKAPEEVALTPTDAMRLDCSRCPFLHICRRLRGEKRTGAQRVVDPEICELAARYLALSVDADAAKQEAERLRNFLVEVLSPKASVETPEGTVVKVLRRRRRVKDEVIPSLIAYGALDLLRPPSARELQQAVTEGRLPKEVLKAIQIEVIPTLSRK